MLMCGMTAGAQTRSARAAAKPVKSFILEAPDTVTQGEPFTVTYTLTATHWEAGYSPETRKGFSVQGVRYSQDIARPYSTMKATVEYVTSQTGNLELPAMTVPVGGNPVVSDTRRIHVLPNSEYGREMTLAHEWLLKKGANADSLSLVQEMKNDHFLLFSDVRLGCFAVVARADVWEGVRQPVLAYSSESAMRNVDRDTYGVLFSLYESQIDSIRKVGASVVSVPMETGEVVPLLGGIRWGQNAPYNTRSPQINGHRILLGCVPIAMSMVMKYHAWPDQGEGEVYISPENSQLFNYKFPKFTPHWSDYRDEYEASDAEVAGDLAQTLGVLSLCTDPDITISSVGVKLINIKHLMCNNLKYSGRMAIERMENVEAKELCNLLMSELNSQRPCIISRAHHAFVCDGYDNGFFHYNLGWHGYCNGYYQLAIGKGGEGLNLLSAIAYGIEPRREEMKKEVALAKPNTLRTSLTEDEQKNVTSLVVSGPIGSDDVRLLRQMAGGTVDGERQQYPWGALRHLDLSNAKIVKDKEAYLTTRATGKWWRTKVSGSGNVNLGVHLYTDTKTFDFDNMDEKTWKSFKAFVGTKQDGIFYTRTDDNKYWSHYNLQANTLGKNMFANCSSLCEVVLPETTKRIDDYAFTGCQSIQVMKIPQKTKELGKVPFDYMPSLVELWIPKGIQFDGKINDHCSPAFKAHGYE